MPKGIKANDKEYVTKGTNAAALEAVSIDGTAVFSNRKRALREVKTGKYDNSSKQ